MAIAPLFEEVFGEESGWANAIIEKKQAGSTSQVQNSKQIAYRERMVPVGTRVYCRWPDNDVSDCCFLARRRSSPFALMLQFFLTLHLVPVMVLGACCV